MKFLTTLTLLAVFIAVGFSSPPSSLRPSCQIVGGIGLFNYDPNSSQGPAKWYSLHETHASCEHGRKGAMQRPVDLSPFCRSNLSSYAKIFGYHVKRRFLQFSGIMKGAAPKPKIGSPFMEFEATPSNFELHCPSSGACGYTIIDGKRFNVVNIHFHSRSEHTINGHHFPLEAHIVHAAAKGPKSLAVISTLFRYNRHSEGPGWPGHTGENRLLRVVLQNLKKGSKKFRVPIRRIIDPKATYMTYTGSLTTPPCTEGVRFFVSKYRPRISRRQVFDYMVMAGASFDGKNRPLQPMNERKTVCVGK